MKLAMLKDATAPQTGERLSGVSLSRTFQATVSGTGPVAATVLIEVSNDQAGWMTLATLDAAGTDMATDGATSRAAWQHMRANLTAISGTGATVNVTFGGEGNG